MIDKYEVLIYSIIYKTDEGGKGYLCMNGETFHSWFDHFII